MSARYLPTERGGGAVRFRWATAPARYKGINCCKSQRPSGGEGDAITGRCKRQDERYCSGAPFFFAEALNLRRYFATSPKRKRILRETESVAR